MRGAGPAEMENDIYQWDAVMRDLEAPGRSPVRARDAMVATPNPLATQAAMAMLGRGGNAVDAAVSAMAVLCVVETLNVTIGGDCFALVAPGGRTPVLAYNGSGRAPMAADAERARARGWRALPATGPHAVTVPGLVEAWARLAAAHGTRGLDELMQPAIAYVEHGYPVGNVIAAQWARAAIRLRSDAETKRLFLWDAAAPRPGQVHHQPDLAHSLRLIARDGGDAFYRGEIGGRIVAHLRSLGGEQTQEDFADHAGEWVDPVALSYRGHLVHECPPNGQGVAALMMLGLLGSQPAPPGGPLAPARLHRAIEAGRMAIAARDRLVGDPAAAAAWPEMLRPATLSGLAGRIDPRRAAPPDIDASLPMGTDTCYIAVVDREGTAVSMIASIFEDFGSGIAVPGTGILLQNRGRGFVLTPGHPNEYGPAKRPLHTIIPALLSREGRVTHVPGRRDLWRAQGTALAADTRRSLPADGHVLAALTSGTGAMTEGRT